MTQKVSFKFYNFWVDHKSFLPTVEEVWRKNIEGSLMFRLISKLKLLKVELRKLNKKEFYNISERVKRLRRTY